MIRYSEELAGRRQGLIARCAAQRKALTVQGQALVERVSGFDLGLTLLMRLKKNPAWIAGLVVGLVVIKPRRLLPMLQTALLAWQALRTLAPALKNIMKCHPDPECTITPWGDEGRTEATLSSGNKETERKRL